MCDPYQTMAYGSKFFKRCCLRNWVDFGRVVMLFQEECICEFDDIDTYEDELWVF